ncbi:PqqD family peptide modification chaperone [Enterococcus mundtii]|uniref:PqqD family peptide modification chaperone n=1 Tax=Enterococcus mundtii TaxID=53346 RepID=UPI0038FCE4D2
MKLNKAIAYEKLGNTIYLSSDEGISLLENEVATYIFDLLTKEQTIKEIKLKVKEKFSHANELTKEGTDLFIENFLTDLSKRSIVC